jgi:hypothetical protein
MLAPVLHPTIFAVLTGTKNPTGVDNVSLGDGYRRLTAEYGLTIYSLLARRIVITSEVQNADLFCGVRGVSRMRQSHNLRVSPSLLGRLMLMPGDAMAIANRGYFQNGTVVTRCTYLTKNKAH